MTFVAITLDNSSQHGCIFSSHVEAPGCRHRADKELDLPRLVLCQVSATKTKRGQVLEGVCKKEITVMDHRFSGR